MLSMIRRVEIAQAAIDRFQLAPLAYQAGDHCWALLTFVMAQAGWPDPVPGLAVKSARGAATALRRYGHADLAEAVDARTPFARIPLAFHLPGDLVWTASDHAMGALGVAVGGGRALAFVDVDAERDGSAASGTFALAGAIDPFLVCWRLEACPR